MPSMFAVKAPPCGGPEVLSLTTVDRPTPGREELLVRVGAIGINRADAMQRAGTYAPPPGQSDVLGLEFAGEVVALGGDVQGFAAGDRIFGLVASGAYAEYAVVHQAHAVKTPPTWDDVNAAAVIEVFCTAHETMFELGRLTAGESILIHAGGSGVGTAAIQMAKHAGAKIFVTAGASHKLDGALRLGASHAINYKERDFATEIMRLSDGGVDLVEDFIGATYFQKHLTILKPRGRLVTVGVLGPSVAEIDPTPILYKRLKVFGFTLRPQAIDEKARVVARFVSHWMPHLIAGNVRPTIHSVLPFADVREAHRMLEAGENFGKIVMTVT